MFFHGDNFYPETIDAEKVSLYVNSSTRDGGGWLYLAMGDDNGGATEMWLHKENLPRLIERLTELMESE